MTADWTLRAFSGATAANTGVSNMASNPIRNNGRPDMRYAITRENTGHEAPHYVARFDGDWIGSSPHYSSAVMLAAGHNARRKGAEVITAQ
jgi:hypothetical protein